MLHGVPLQTHLPASRLKSSASLATIVLDVQCVASLVLAVFGPRRASCCSCLPTNSSLNFSRNSAEEWWKVSARTVRTVCRSCFNHERRRRCLRRFAAIAINLTNSTAGLIHHWQHAKNVHTTSHRENECVWTSLVVVVVLTCDLTSVFIHTHQ